MSSRRQLRRSASVAAPQVWPHVTLTVLFAAAITPLIVILLVVRTPLVLPSLSLISIASAAMVALLAWCTSSERDCDRVTLWDVSGAYAFIGFAAGMLSEPEQVMEFLALPANVHESGR
jgi:hypothetical protein